MTDNNSLVRITFACSSELRELLTSRASSEGISRGQLIVELLETEMNTDTQGRTRNPAVNRLIFDIQQRVGELEAWKQEVSRWNKDTAANSANLEETVAYLMNETSSPTGDIGKVDKTKKGSIPSPKSKSGKKK